jgi:autoinducer 2-degrading protein
MTFEPEKVDDFLAVFNQSKENIAAFPGCHGLKLLQDAEERNVFYTYSLWIDDHSLQRYRRSELFKAVWTDTRALFCAKPMAWSTHVIDNVK